ncbi:uncharacterized protein LOC130805317 [Amaranthus tricolor]|uniref:uncharacterized protein LOC130805317 n=1 Tax=Amaranthus tricolor TaxID=29722 RepID=UPI0025866859|nr:uncharacterized protein LOC130805317 [Amaranthus tricolor]XP_057526027.1 uncharacterized protein LOC130805317 [Amaranthus tricolor]
MTAGRTYTPPVPFPSRLAQAKLEHKYGKFLKVLSKLQINIPFLEAIKEMPSYAKFLKDIISNKRKLEESVVETLNGQCSAILHCKLPKKQADPGSFTIPLKLGKDVSAVALADLGASVSVMSLTLCKKINGEMKATRMSIQLADRSVRYPIGILEDFPVQVGNYFVSCDFVIMDMEEDARIPVILGRDFLKTTAANFDVKIGKLSLEILGEQLHFHLPSSMAHSAIGETVYRVDAIVDATTERESTPSIVDPLYAAIEGNYEKDRADVIEMVQVLDVAPTFVPAKAKFEDILPWKVSTIEEQKECTTPPQVESKSLPPSLKYVFLEDNDTYPVIVNVELNGTQIERLLTVLKKYKECYWVHY